MITLPLLFDHICSVMLVNTVPAHGAVLRSCLLGVHWDIAGDCLAGGPSGLWSLWSCGLGGFAVPTTSLTQSGCGGGFRMDDGSVQ